MPIEKKAFTNYKLEEERAKEKGRTAGVWFNNEELKDLEFLAHFFHQEKESTTIKHCVGLAKTILEGGSSETFIRDVVFNNVRKNKRLGIQEVDPKFRIS